MDATNVIFHVSVLGLRRKQEAFGSRKGRSCLETCDGWQHGCAYHVLLDLAEVLILLRPAGGIAGLVGNPGGVSYAARHPSSLYSLSFQRLSWSDYRATLRNRLKSDSITSTVSMPYSGYAIFIFVLDVFFMGVLHFHDIPGCPLHVIG